MARRRRGGLLVVPSLIHERVPHRRGPVFVALLRPLATM